MRKRTTFFAQLSANLDDEAAKFHFVGLARPSAGVPRGFAAPFLSALMRTIRERRLQARVEALSMVPAPRTPIAREPLRDAA